MRSRYVHSFEDLSPERGVSFLVPRPGAFVRLGSGRAEIQAPGWSASFDGLLADDIAQVARGRVSARLEALATFNEAAASVISWRGDRWVPLTVLDALRLDGFDTLFLELVGTCNERCVHCYAESSPQVEAALEQDICEQVIDDAFAAGFRRIQFTGGDPLLCKFLPALLERASKFQTREVYTNALLLDDRMLDRLAPYKPCFAVSYYSSEPSAHDAITRTPGSQRRTRAAIMRALARGLAVRVSIVVMNENVATIDATVADLEGAGVKDVAVAAGRTAGRGSAFAWQPKAAMPTTSGGHRATNAIGDGKIAVTYEGLVVPCIFNRSRVLGSLHEGRRLRDVLASPSVTPGPAADSEKLSCTSCQITDIGLSILGEPA